MESIKGGLKKALVGGLVCTCLTSCGQDSGDSFAKKDKSVSYTYPQTATSRTNLREDRNYDEPRKNRRLLRPEDPENWEYVQSYVDSKGREYFNCEGGKEKDRLYLRFFDPQIKSTNGMVEQDGVPEAFIDISNLTNERLVRAYGELQTVYLYGDREFVEMYDDYDVQVNAGINPLENSVVDGVGPRMQDNPWRIQGSYYVKEINLKDFKLGPSTRWSGGLFFYSTDPRLRKNPDYYDSTKRFAEITTYEFQKDGMDSGMKGSARQNRELYERSKIVNEVYKDQPLIVVNEEEERRLKLEVEKRLKKRMDELSKKEPWGL